MLGLGVLYDASASEHPEWAAIPERDRAACLREAHWAQHAEKERSKAGGARRFIHARMRWHVDRPAMGRSADDPGDAFVHLVNFPGLDGSQFEWIEVAELTPRPDAGNWLVGPAPSSPWAAGSPDVLCFGCACQFHSSRSLFEGHSLPKSANPRPTR